MIMHSLTIVIALISKVIHGYGGVRGRSFTLANDGICSGFEAGSDYAINNKNWDVDTEGDAKIVEHRLPAVLCMRVGSTWAQQHLKQNRNSIQLSTNSRGNGFLSFTYMYWNFDWGDGTNDIFSVSIGENEYDISDYEKIEEGTVKNVVYIEKDPITDYVYSYKISGSFKKWINIGDEIIFRIESNDGNDMETRVDITNYFAPCQK